MDKYLGKYRGTVLDNADPMQMGRLMAQVPDVSNVLPGTWAMPCVPFAGIQAGQLVVPSIGAGVWIEFEQGNPDYPVWTGCFWGSAAEMPALALAAPPATQQLVIQTMLQTTLVVSDLPGPTGGILLKTASGALIAINDTGITISNGQGATIVLSGPSVTMNEGALVVT
ncbi:baseplate assembly protein [Burkholderia sp. R-69980]|nr:baseplate assembly protein [Burkholderia sp. R-69980]